MSLKHGKFHENQKSAKRRIFWSIDYEVANLSHVKISLQPKFQGSSCKNDQDRGSVINTLKKWKISGNIKNPGKGDFFWHGSSNSKFDPCKNLPTAKISGL